MFNRCGRPLATLGDGPGFHSVRDGEPNRSHTGNVVRALGQIEDGDPYIFELKATSTAATSDGDGV